jgi:hypothetical protein
MLVKLGQSAHGLPRPFHGEGIRIGRALQVIDRSGQSGPQRSRRDEASNRVCRFHDSVCGSKIARQPKRRLSHRRRRPGRTSFFPVWQSARTTRQTRQWHRLLHIKAIICSALQRFYTGATKSLAFRWRTCLGWPSSVRRTCTIPRPVSMLARRPSCRNRWRTVCSLTGIRLSPAISWATR